MVAKLEVRVGLSAAVGLVFDIRVSAIVVPICFDSLLLFHATVGLSDDDRVSAAGMMDGATVSLVISLCHRAAGGLRFVELVTDSCVSVVGRHSASAGLISCATVRTLLGRVRHSCRLSYSQLLDPTEGESVAKSHLLDTLMSVVLWRLERHDLR